MQNITSTAGLKNTIQLLEAQHAYNGLLLKEQFQQIYDGFKPVNILKSTLKDAVSSSTLLDNILSTSVGIASGYLSKKIVVGTSGNIIRKFIGSVLQLGVTKLVAQNPEIIKSMGLFVFQHIFRKKEMNSE